MRGAPRRIQHFGAPRGHPHAATQGWVPTCTCFSNPDSNARHPLQATNAVAASQDFAKTEFPARVVSSLSRLLAIAEGRDADGSWILSDIVSVGNAVVGEKLRALLSVIQGLKNNEAVLQRRTADLVQGNPVVAQLQERIQSLELDGAAKRKQLEALSMQLDIERDQRASQPNRSSPDRGSTSQQIDLLQRELQMVSDTKAKLEEDNMSLKRKVIDVEDSNNQLRKQLVDTRREAEIAGPRSAQAAEQ
jgi:hypothetical protein